MMGGEVDQARADRQQSPARSEPAPSSLAWWHLSVRPLRALFRRGDRFIEGFSKALAARGAANITRQFHRLDRRSGFEDLDL